VNRRQFIASTGLAAAGVAAQAAETVAAGDRGSKLFRRVDFRSDGLGLDPLEYTTLLGRLAASRDLKADDYSIGGAVEELEQGFARLLGKERAIFLPTGTLANHMAVRKLAGPDRRVLIQAESHLYNDCGDCAETLSGLNLIPLAPDQATFELADIKRWVERSAGGRVETNVGVIAIESPVRRKGHEMFDVAEMEKICAYAREHGIRLHLDGARMFNLPYHSHKTVRAYASLFDTVYVSLWKHFNGASGAILAGDNAFIDGLFHMRRMFGGSLPHAWPEIALVMQYAEGYETEYARAWHAADEFIALLQANGRFEVEKLTNGTSLFFLHIRGAVPESLTERLSTRDIVFPHARPGTQTFALQVNATILRTSPGVLFQALTEALQ
jgi:threonine aldolase